MVSLYIVLSTMICGNPRERLYFIIRTLYTNDNIFYKVNFFIFNIFDGKLFILRQKKIYRRFLQELLRIVEITITKCIFYINYIFSRCAFFLFFSCILLANELGVFSETQARKWNLSGIIGFQFSWYFWDFLKIGKSGDSARSIYRTRISVRCNRVFCSCWIFSSFSYLSWALSRRSFCFRCIYVHCLYSVWGAYYAYVRCDSRIDKPDGAVALPADSTDGS